MRCSIRSFVWVLALSLAVGCAGSTPVPQLSDAYGSVGKARSYRGMGKHQRVVTTNSARAQEYFNQGLAWLHAFNHDEAVRAFRRAAELDPDCAMAWWGIAYAQGPNYNDPMMSEARSAAAWSALQEARGRMEHASEVERDLIEALSHRYANPPPTDRTDLERAFSEAMEALWQKYPSDSDIGTWYAESMMVRQPWKLYTIEGVPQPDTPKIVAALERVMEIDPGNPGANHLYIHAVEPSENPDRALPAADRLSTQVPAAGHLLHMPSHIYVQTGHWQRSIEQNALAMKADAKYRGLSTKQGLQHFYMVHNAHMLAFSAMMVGQEREAMAAARGMWNNVPADAMAAIGPAIDRWMCSVYDVQKRFGRWEAILAEPAPPANLPITTAYWHSHRAIAHAAKKQFDAAEKELAAFRAARAKIPAEVAWSGSDTVQRVMEVAELFTVAEIALQRGQLEDAARVLEQAAAIEDTLSYDEPPQYLQPVRHTLGAVYMAMGRPADAERVYRKDLSKWRANGWALYGLSRSLEVQGRMAEASQILAQFQTAWAGADEPLTTSCKCVAKL